MSARTSHRPRRHYIVRGGVVAGWARTRAQASQRGGPRAYIVGAGTRRTALNAARFNRWA